MSMPNTEKMVKNIGRNAPVSIPPGDNTYCLGKAPR